MAVINPTLPTVGGSANTWGTEANTVFAAIIAELNAKDAQIATLLGGLRGVDSKTAGYTFALADAGRQIEYNSSSNGTFIVPPTSAVAWPIGTVVTVFLAGAGALSLAGGTGVTLQSPAGLKLTTQFAAASLIHRATDVWAVSGQTVV